jgi:transcriptional regulator with XRE-family HTH domain
MKLKDWLDKEGLTVSEFARLMGSPQPTVWRYVNGDRMPEKEAMRKITELTKRKVDARDFYELAP